MLLVIFTWPIFLQRLVNYLNYLWVFSIIILHLSISNPNFYILSVGLGGVYSSFGTILLSCSEIEIDFLLAAIAFHDEFCRIVLVIGLFLLAVVLFEA